MTNTSEQLNNDNRLSEDWNAELLRNNQWDQTDHTGPKEGTAEASV